MNDCVFNNGRNCNALTQKDCDACHFRKTPGELMAGRMRASTHITTLPTDAQEHIYAKYYSKKKGRRVC